MRRFLNVLITSIAVFIIALCGFTLSLLTANLVQLDFFEAKCGELIKRMEIKNAKER